MTASYGTARDPLSRSFLEALRVADGLRAFELSKCAIDEGMSFTELYQHVMAPAMHEVGELWAAGAITVADEHLATALTHQVLTTLRSQTWVEGRTNQVFRGRALLATVEGEHHSLGLRMAADLLEDAGYEAVYLGPNVPTKDLLQAVRVMEPDLLALAATMPEAGRVLPEVVARVRDLRPELKLITGGAAASSSGLGGPEATGLESLLEHVAAGPNLAD